MRATARVLSVEACKAMNKLPDYVSKRKFLQHVFGLRSACNYSPPSGNQYDPRTEANSRKVLAALEGARWP